MNEEKRASERKRVAQDPSTSDLLPKAKKPKTAEDTASNITTSPESAVPASKQAPPPARAAVNFSLANPKTPPSALTSTSSPPVVPVPAEPAPPVTSLTKSSELRAKHRALLEEPDSDDSDDSDD